MGAFALVMAFIQVTGTTLASEWTEREFAKFRILTNATTIDTSGQALIGLEIDLEPGWQFYSEEPGEFGVAPEFDWTASHNLAEASIFWPKPTQYLYSTDPLVTTLGYKGSVLLPVVLGLETDNEDLKIRLDLDYAVCAEVCIFDTVNLGLTLPAGWGERTRHSERLERALAESQASNW